MRPPRPATNPASAYSFLNISTPLHIASNNVAWNHRRILQSSLNYKTAPLVVKVVLVRPSQPVGRGAGKVECSSLYKMLLPVAIPVPSPIMWEITSVGDQTATFISWMERRKLACGRKAYKALSWFCLAHPKESVLRSHAVCVVSAIHDDSRDLWGCAMGEGETHQRHRPS